MAEHRLQIGKVQIVFFRGEKRALVLLAVVIALTGAALGTVHAVERSMARQTQELQAQAARVEYENDVLSQNIQELGSVRSVERIAREELGMVSPDTVMIEAQVK